MTQDDIVEWGMRPLLPDKHELPPLDEITTQNLIWRLQFMAWRMSSQLSIRRCKKFVNPRQDEKIVTLRRFRTKTGEERRQFEGLCLCGSAQCPRCAQIISLQRSQRLEKGLIYWLDSKNHLGQNRGLLFMTFTMSHKRNDSLRSLLNALTDARIALTNGRAYRGEKGDRVTYDIAGILSVVEVTYSDRNGYHPHIHILVMIDRPITAEDAVNITSRFHERWKRALEKHGVRSILRMTDVKPIRNYDEGSKEYIAHYLNKAAPMRILESFSDPKYSVDRKGWTFFEMMTFLIIREQDMRCWFPLESGQHVEWNRPDHMRVMDDRTGEIIYESTMTGIQMLWRQIHEMETELKGIRPYRFSKRRPDNNVPLDQAWNNFLNACNGADADDTTLMNQRRSKGQTVGYLTQGQWITNYVNHPANIITELNLGPVE